MRIILIIILIYVTYQWVVKPLLGIFLQYVLKKFINEQMKNSQGRPSEQRKPEGSINIDYIPKDKKPHKGHSDDGEYVDYEEIK